MTTRQTTQAGARTRSVDGRSPEARVLVHASRTDSRATDRLRAALDSDPDWDEVGRLARRNAVSPLVHRTFTTYCPDRVPKDLLDRLKTDAERSATHCLRFARELGTVLDVLDDAGVRAIPYRGPVLAQDAYGDLGRRPFSDLDLLVDRADLPEARNALLAEGYEPESLHPETDARSGRQERRFIQYCRDYPLYHPGRETTVELHWRVLDLRFPTAIDLETVWPRRETTTIGGRTVPVFGTADRLLAMCVHGTRHRFERLRWLCDIAEYCRGRECNWETALARARAHDAGRMFLLGPLLVHDLFGTELPAELHRRIEDDDVLDELRQTTLDAMFGTPDRSQFDVQRYQLRAVESQRDRARLLSGWAFKPRGYEIERFDPPRPLLPAYYLYRPLRLAGLALGLVDPPE